MISAEVTITAQFYDLDPMEVVWHGNYPRFLEQARSALLERVGFNYREMAATKFIWPIVDMRIKYVRPIRLGQQVRVVATLVEYENRIKVEYRLLDAGSGEVLTKAETVQVAVETATAELHFTSPPEFTEKVEKLL